MPTPLRTLRAATLAFAVLAAQTLASPPAAVADPPPSAGATKSGKLSINGIRYYFEIHGTGEPLLLLHGGLGSIGMFGPVLPRLAKERTVIAVDLHGHGRTELGSRPIDLVAMGDDMAALVQALGYPQLDVLGYSMGGGVAFRMAVQHPGTVRRLAIVSCGYSQDGFHPELLPMQAAVGAAMAEQMKESPMYKSYVAVAPKPEDFPRLLDEMGAWMRRPYDWSADVTKLAQLPIPVLLVYGDADMFRLQHVTRFYELLGGGLRDAGWQREHLSRNRLAILPNRTHYDVFFAPELAETVLPFLDGVTEVKTWEELLAGSE